MKKLLLALLGLTIFVNAADNKVEYPENYRDWSHIKSMVINDAHSLAASFEGIHHIYANKKAKKGLITNDYEKGAKFVFDLLEAKRTKETTTEGKRKFIGVMEYDSKKYEKTGNWGYEAFAGDSKTNRVVEDGGVSCFQCHIAVKNKSYVWTENRK